MTAKDLAREMAKTYGLNIASAMDMVNGVFYVLGQVLYDDHEHVKIHGFGSFKQKVIKEKRYIDKATGEEKVIPAYIKIKFTPSEKAKKRGEENDG